MNLPPMFFSMYFQLGMSRGQHPDLSAQPFEKVTMLISDKGWMNWTAYYDGNLRSERPRYEENWIWCRCAGLRRSYSGTRLFLYSNADAKQGVHSIREANNDFSIGLCDLTFCEGLWVHTRRKGVDDPRSWETKPSASSQSLKANAIKPYS